MVVGLSVEHARGAAIVVGVGRRVLHASLGGGAAIADAAPGAVVAGSAVIVRAAAVVAC